MTQVWIDILLVTYLVGIVPFGLYWLLVFQSPWNNDVYLPVLLGVLWPVLLVPCLVAQGVRRGQRRNRHERS